MSSRPLLTPFKVIKNGDMSSPITSAVTIIENLSMLSYDVSWSGSSPAGTLDVQVSNTVTLNAGGAVQVAGDWTSLTLSTTPTVSGNTGNGFIDLALTGAYAVRLVYTPSGGTGTMQATINAKVA